MSCSRVVIFVWVALVFSHYTTGSQRLRAAERTTVEPDLYSQENHKEIPSYSYERHEHKLRNRDSTTLPVVSDAGATEDSIPVKRRRSRRIVNGKGTFGFPSLGALLMGHDPRDAKIACSGTLIGCDRFITAAHCVSGAGSPNDIKVFFQNYGFFEVREIALPVQYKGPNDIHADLAILRLDRAVDGAVPVEINPSGKPAWGTSAMIVGYGRTGGVHHDAGIKREGFVKTAPCNPGRPGEAIVCWDFAQTEANKESNTCKGDSGGALYREGTSGAAPILIGTTAGGLKPDCLAGDHSYDVDVSSYSDWIRAKLDPPHPGVCGTLPQINTKRNVLGSIYRLDQHNVEIREKFYVNKHTEILRVSMSGEDDYTGKNDFDLYVGGPAVGKSPETYVCSETGAGQFAFCEINSPEPGEWSVIVRRKKGDGLAQVAVTFVPR